MTSTERLAQRAATFLPPGSHVRQAFICQSAPSPWFFLITYLTGLTMPWMKYRCVVVTKGAIYVLEGTKLSGGAMPKSLVATLPRRTRFGPVPGRWPQVDLLGDRHWVMHKRFHGEITDADREAGFKPSA